MALGALVLPAWGEGAAPSPVAGPDGGPPEAPPRRLPHAFVEACARGAAQYAAHDYASAIETFRGAIELAPQAAVGPYLLGEALFASGDVTGAEDAWGRAGAASEGDPAMRARVLFVVAQAKEQQKKWGDARAAWDAYRAWAARFPQAAAFTASADARAAAIDTMLAQERAAEVVRKRIAETRDGGVFTDPKAEPPRAPEASPMSPPMGPRSTTAGPVGR